MIIRWNQWASSSCRSSYILATGLILQALGAASVAVPSSNCYALDSSSQLVDFSSWMGHLFEYAGKDGDLAVHFCKDVESRSNTGYVDFGRFDNFNHFVAGSGHVDFVQRFYGGDLYNCEKSYDKLGRTAQVNIICGKCSTGQCIGDPLGCICNATYESPCRVSVDLAIPCKKQGPRLFQGFTVGFHPRSKEIVHNAITQPGYDKSQDNFSFMTEQAHLALYMTAIASLSSLVQKPIVKVFPDEGLEVGLSGTAMDGNHPTTLSPTMLVLDWRCEKPRDSPYEVQVTVPVEGYESIEFTLSKMCAFKQDVEEEDSLRGWAVFGILSCVCITLSTLLCLGGFIYKTRVEHQHGIEALPGITYLSVCLETVGGGNNGYSRPEDLNGAFPNQPSSSSWERPTTTSNNQRTYGSV